MKQISMRIALVLTVLLLASMACGLPGRSATQPPTAVPMTQEEMQQLEEELKATLANPAPSGEVTVTITQQQLSAYLAAQVAEMNQDDPSFRDPVVVLTGGNMEIYGKVTQSGITLDTKVVMKPGVDASGSPTLDVVSVDLGGMPVPDALKSRMESMVDGMLQDYLSQNGSFVISSLAVGEGQMTVTGTPQ